MTHALSNLGRFAVATVLVAAWAFASPGVATAGCGEPMLTLSHAAPDDADPVAPKPCHGPNCSASPAPTDLPPSAPSGPAPSSQEWAAAVAPFLMNLTRDFTSAIPDSFGEPVASPSLPFHPPRSR
jgi:hypothetical protein